MVETEDQLVESLIEEPLSCNFMRARSFSQDTDIVDLSDSDHEGDESVSDPHDDSDPGLSRNPILLERDELMRPESIYTPTSTMKPPIHPLTSQRRANAQLVKLLRQHQFPLPPEPMISDTFVSQPTKGPKLLSKIKNRPLRR